MKKRICLADEVGTAQSFLDLSEWALKLYLTLCFETDSTGRIVNAERTARGIGATREHVKELLESGFLLQIGDLYFISHTWVNNKYDARYTKYVEALPAYKRGALGFEAEFCKSRYVLLHSDEHTSHERRTGDEHTSHERRTGDEHTSHERRNNNNNNSNNNDNDQHTTAKATAKANSTGKGIVKGKTQKDRVQNAHCPRCGKETAATILEGADGMTVRYECPECGIYEKLLGE